MVADFKANVDINKSQRESNYQFYNAVMRSLFGIVTYYSINGVRHKFTFGYFSRVLDKSANHAKACYLNLFNDNKDFSNLFPTIDGVPLFGGHIKEDTLWSLSDNGPTFKSNKWLNHVKVMAKLLNVDIDAKFLGPYHGKSDCDIYFGAWTKIIKDFRLSLDSNIMKRTTASIVDYVNNRFAQHHFNTKPATQRNGVTKRYKQSIVIYPTVESFTRQALSDCAISEALLPY
ncbi:hypothetical protein SAMD00019534_126840 [Acytostelium subglobosum LB1]|uniref:hypothetical protein n=1 Tax=Acytostelium subglobosum LB1 TaxID=1410327 RepID=UPI000644E238|nr:hypothetical protein SAMD00019534_126840 [Acytostelium subglobosum LB1]GAM29508.1 hypothetical protein SAMD00019534_126840 [Acytostelium subglobosum LB1]|eukprot:XP_012747544.1 hypothetical protein SAMD00019534_126840 [Acytostelium subglobosum LB1]